MTTNLNLTDIEACYKVFKRELIQSVTLEENRFGIEPELVAKIARTGARIYEVAISYHGRTYAEGKKIGWKDGISALRCILKYGLLRQIPTPPTLPLTMILPSMILPHLFVAAHPSVIHGRDDHAPLFRTPRGSARRPPGRDIVSHVPFFSRAAASLLDAMATLPRGA